jgi:hypothetical protein
VSTFFLVVCFSGKVHLVLPFLAADTLAVFLLLYDFLLLLFLVILFHIHFTFENTVKMTTVSLEENSEKMLNLPNCMLVMGALTNCPTNVPNQAYANNMQKEINFSPKLKHQPSASMVDSSLSIAYDSFTPFLCWTGVSYFISIEMIY